MRTAIALVTVFGMALLLASCKPMLTEQELPPDIHLNDNYFSQLSFQYEKGRHRTTNYRTGGLIPINTEVILRGISRKMIEVQVVSSGVVVEIENVAKHTNDDVYQAFRKYFGKTKVNLSRFSAKERANILTGTVAKGMRKDAVVLALGYPPVTETATLDIDVWVYWRKRFDRFKVHFGKGRVVRIEN